LEIIGVGSHSGRNSFSAWEEDPGIQSLDFPRIAVGWCTTTPASSVFSIVFHAYTHTQKINWRAIICGVFSSLTRTDCHAPIYASLRVEYNRRDLSQSGSASTTAALTVVVSLFFSSLLDNASSLLPCAALLRESFVGASSPRSEEPRHLLQVHGANGAERIRVMHVVTRRGRCRSAVLERGSV